MISRDDETPRKRRRLHVSGTVQGVGFRPFVYRLAVRKGLGGFVMNRPDGVVAELEGSPDSIDAFIDALLSECPPLASITGISSAEVAPLRDSEFRIVPSENRGEANVHITPDAATCPDCLRELFDPSDRRFRYPFINCTNCGPRLTIIREIPYDRQNTAMGCFPLCPECRAEYDNPDDRRFHAEPNACPLCGPRITLLDSRGVACSGSDAVRDAAELVRRGHIVAMKSLGGYHLCVDAGNDGAVARLRSLKYREEKPLALMSRTIETVGAFAVMDHVEEELLKSPERPIVLMKKKGPGPISDLVAPGVPDFGVMLPSTPLHHLLLENHFHALVMTSANQVDEPICTGNREALERLRGIADYFLVNDRDILVRCDDSIAFVAGGNPRLLRRSRGYAPGPLPLKRVYPTVVALGAHLKSTICVIRGGEAFMSPHIGDLETPRARDFFDETLELMKNITRSEPGIIAFDRHPAYYSSRVALQAGSARVIPVQHHHAHIASCMAEHRIEGPVIGLAMDGTGYGDDGNAWGGEFLVADETGFRRFCHLRYIMLPGGETAIRQPWRTAVSLLRSAFGPEWKEWARRLNLVPDPGTIELLDTIMESAVNAPLSSGLGRVFDGVAALTGLRSQVSFEGQAAMELESIAGNARGPSYPFDILSHGDGPRILDLSGAVRAIAEDICRGREHNAIAASFHGTLIDAFMAVVDEMREATGIETAVLSGGCFQNRLLLEATLAGLRDAGFDAFCNRQVPSNDGGLALGQAVIAASIAEKGNEDEA